MGQGIDLGLAQCELSALLLDLTQQALGEAA